MKISKPKKALAAKIRNSGFAWPDSGKWAIQDKDGEVFVCSGISVPVRRMGEVNWEFGEPYRSAGILSLGPNWFQCILSRDEYFHLYPAPDSDGWIVWNGGECPVERGTLIDVKHRNKEEYIGVPALGRWNYAWLRSGINPDDIIAYRLHKPEQPKSTAVGDDETNMAAKEELEALEFEPSAPTIEQLAAEYRNRKDFAERKQQEADAAKADAEAKLAELIAAGKEVGLVLSVAAPEPELVITDWRDLQVGDEVEASYRGIERLVGPVLKIDFGDNNQPIFVSDGVRSIWATEFRFIRRP